MYKAISNTNTFVLVYLISVLPICLADSGMAGSGSILYVMSMLVLCSICFIRGDIIGKKWLVLIPVVAFVLHLLPAFSAISFTSYLYHLLAIIIGVASPVVVLAQGDIRKA